jgi:cytochrome c-type biogenesis protein CcmH/NrfG
MAARETASASRAAGQARWLPALAAGLAALVYLNALDNPFVYDDHATVLNNPSLPDPGNWRFVLVYSLFRPVVNVSYALDYALWETRPFGYHLTNLVLHILNVLLLYRLTWLTARDGTGQGRPFADVAPSTRLLAFAAAALFAVHPLMTEAVGYVSGRSEVICGTFFLAALLLLRRGLVDGRAEQAPPPRVARRERWLAAGVVTFLLALASKETAVMLPFVFFAYERLCLAGSPEDRRRRAWRIHTPLMGLVVVAAAARLATLVLAERPMPGAPWQTILTHVTVVIRYLGLLVLPVSQSIVHPVRQITSALDPALLMAVAVLLAIFFGAWGLRRRAPLVTFGMFWFFLVLLPSSSVVSLRESMAEHRVYLASCGLFVAAGAAIVWRASTAPRAARAGRTTWSILSIVLAALAVLTVQRNLVWASPVALWANAAQRAPDYWEAHYVLGDALREQGRCQDAIDEYRLVTQLRPGHRDAYNNLGICLAETGRLAEAGEAFARALAVDPRFARAETNLGGLALLENDPERARQHFERALALDPSSLAARRQLASLYETTFNNPAEASRLCREMLAIAPRAPGAAECVARNEARLPPGPGAR